MNPRTTTIKWVFALDPYSRGFGFVVSEGPEHLIDWGLKEARREKDTRCLQHVAQLIETYHPDVFVIETIWDPRCRRCPRIRELLQKMSQLAAEKKLKTRSFSRQAVQATFSDVSARTKDEIMTAIVERLPELTPWRPPFRKPWMSEHSRASIFDAVALALTYFYCAARK
jgi:Holliday junction resolvasome RuvABC endonuclease subunit